MVISKAEAAARNILKEYGIDTIESLAKLNLKDLIQARGSFYEEKEMEGEDGRKVSFKDRGIITINKLITDTGKKDSLLLMSLGTLNFTKTYPSPQILNTNFALGFKLETMKKKLTILLPSF